jgi:hypothetical protein
MEAISISLGRVDISEKEGYCGKSGKTGTKPVDK